MNFNDFDEFAFAQDTIKNISYDKENREYMSNSQLKIFNFDKVKDNFVRKYSFAKQPKSVDGCIQKNDYVALIEFKNGKIDDKCKNDVYDKIFSSVFILSAIADEKISNLKNICQFILVYNQSKNRDFVISFNLNKDAKQQSKTFDLSGYEKLFFSKTHIFSQNDFENFLNNFDQ
ncbi:MULTISPECIES: hypothetical protein [unclassified Campylobacter]|uniref:hypothetical protein n=1 Tax=unclassified Campylobacter TaxID=2593542 RepID=UPI0014728DFB|nr:MULTISPECIES: hypothetical protein [unclassified Campylobacter]